VPLVVALNGRTLGELRKGRERLDQWSWRRIAIDKVPQRQLELTLMTDAPAMNAWRLGIDNTVKPRHSALSFDQGRTWQNDSMGAHQALSGEYIVRIHSHANLPREAAPPPIMYEQLDHPRCRELAAMVPVRIRKQRNRWKRLLALRSWVAGRWSHDPFGAAYCPWDAPTILDWVGNDRPHGQKGRVAMCVHFATVLSQFAAALGHRSRCLAITREINSMYGHFVTEVFDDAQGKWIVHDANYDAHYEDGQPLGITELADRALAGVIFKPFVRLGSGMPTAPARVVRGFRNHFATGTSYRCASVWTRNNMISDPTGMPPNHGSVVYTETDFTWYNPAGHDIAPMFPHRTAKRDYFTQPPAD
jgi:hypothetical protein